jgi:LysR family transcriptional regulator, glycine cleavage system transcriptional activator
MKRLPPLAALEAFMVVARHESLTSASAHLNLTVSALSRRIQTLEHHLGVALFERNKRKFALLPIGKRLLDDVAPALDTLAQTTEHFYRTHSVAPLRIGVMQGFATTWLLPRLKHFNAAHPDISLELDTLPLALTRLGNNLDAAITLLAEPHPAYFCQRLAQNYIVPVCAPSLLTQLPSVTAVDPRWLETQPVLLHKDMTDNLPKWCAKTGFATLKPKRIEVYDSGALLLEAAANGLGVSFLLDMTVESALAEGRLVEPFQARVKSTQSFCFVAKETTMQQRAVARFHKWLLAQSALPA